MPQMQQEVAEKENQGVVRVVLWEELKKDLPRELKVSPIVMIPHKSRLCRAILDLSYKLKLTPEELLKLVNKSTPKTAPLGAIDQLGHSLSRIIHAFAEVNNNIIFFMTKWDIKGRRGVQLRIRVTAEGWYAHQTCYPYVTADGIDRVPPVLLGDVRDGQGRG